MSKAGLAIFIILVLSSVILSLFVFNQLDWIQNVRAQQQQQTAPGITGNTLDTVETANAAGSNNMTGVTFLFIQSAESGSLSEINTTTSTLELSDVSDKTIMFSDRPNRIVASIDTTDFIGNWSTGPNSFAADPPNVALVVHDDVEQRQDLAVIELFNPEYDSEANTLKFDITAENATTTIPSINLPREFGQSTLVIDDWSELRGVDTS
jgi:hypothetical protein